MSRFMLTLVLAATVGGAASAQPDATKHWRRSEGVFCAVLARALAAANEPEAFASIRIADAGNPYRSSLQVPGFTTCEARPGSLYCSQEPPGPDLTLENLTADTARCLGMRPRDDEGFQVFDMGKVAIQIESDCTGCQSGHRVNYRIEVD